MKTTEVSDTIVSCLEAALRAWRTLGILVNFELHSLFDEGVWDNLEYMKKLTATTNRDPEVLIALSIADSEFYNSRLQKLLRVKAFMMEHSATMEEDLAFFSALPEDFTLPVARKVKTALARLSVYRAELPEDLMKPSLDVASKRVVAFTRSGATKSAGDRVAFVPAYLSEVCAEMSICFAFDAEVDELVTQVAELTASSASAGMEQSAVALLEQIAAMRTPRMSQDSFETLMAFNTKRQVDLQLDPSHAPLSSRVVASLGAMVRSVIAEPFGAEGPIELQSMQVIVSWLGGSSDAAMLVKAWARLYHLVQGFQDFQRLGEDLTTRMETDMKLGADDCRLAACSRALKAMQEQVELHTIEKLDAQLGQELKQAMDNAVTLVKQVAEVRIATVNKEVDDIKAELNDIAAGAKNGTSWTVGLPGGSNSNTLKAHYDKTLGLLAMNDISDPLLKLTQALETQTQIYASFSQIPDADSRAACDAIFALANATIITQRLMNVFQEPVNKYDRRKMLQVVLKDAANASIDVDSFDKRISKKVSNILSLA